MNELEDLALLRDEVPVRDTQAVEETVLAEILAPGRRESARKPRTTRPAPRWGLRPVIAGRAAAVAGTAALAGAAAVTAVNLGAPAGTVTLAAWTVTAGPDHAVHVTIRQLSDPAGLQRELRADGVPARVAFAHDISDSPPLPAGCRPPAIPVQENINLQSKILDESGETIANQVTFTVHPQAIPHGIGIYLTVVPESSNGGYGWGLDLVQAAKACTG
jgi:hypothetical protein